MNRSYPTSGAQRRVQNPKRAKHDSTPDAQAQRPVSRDFSKLSTGVIENMHFIFSKVPNPNPSLLFNLYLLLKVCQHHQVYTTMYKCVSIFTIIFFEGVKLSH